MGGMHHLKLLVALLFLSPLNAEAKPLSYDRVDYKLVVEEERVPVTGNPIKSKPLPEVVFTLPDPKTSLALAEEETEWILKAVYTIHAAGFFFESRDPDKVFRIQNLLRQLGGNVGSVDGIVGPNTQKGLLQVKTRVLQTLLKELGEDPGPLDGVYGSKTAKALASYWDRQGLDMEETWSFDTIRLLLNRLVDTRKSL